MTPFPAPKVSTMRHGNFAAAAQRLKCDPWIMRQAWLAKPDENLRAATVRFGWEPNALWVLADLPDDFITSRSTDHSQDMWTLGDVFEIFVARSGSPSYLELHVTPHNHRLHLHLTAEGMEKIRSGQSTLNEFRRPPSAFDSWVQKSTDLNQWQVLARIPANILPEGQSLAAGQSLELSFSRYDAGPEGAADVLSSTSAHRELNYHRRHEWREVVLKDS